ncbi:MAG: phosphotransferase [Dehalococcoidia bacterium]|nr:phosphotransferase [Dehalococcoidia bacterium]
MTELTPLPPSIESLTPEWLTAALRSGGALPEGSVTAFGHEIIGEGIGFIGTVARLKLQYSGAGPEAPATAIAKLPSEDPGSRMVGVAFGLYEREVRFYSDLAGDCGLPAPKPYFSHYDAGAGQAAIILEDLTGGAFGDQVAGASLAEAELAIDAIGAFHARWWESPEFARYPWITSGIETIRQPIQLMYAAAWPVAMERFGYVFPEELRPLIPDFGRRTMAALDQMTLGPETLVHGDYRPDNLFFGAPGGARPLVACDWQSPGKATGVVDAAYFITGSMEPADRRKARRRPASPLPQPASRRRREGLLLRPAEDRLPRLLRGSHRRWRRTPRHPPRRERPRPPADRVFDEPLHLRDAGSRLPRASARVVTARGS